MAYLDNQLVLLLEQQDSLWQGKLKAQAQVMENLLFVVLVLKNSVCQFRDIHLQLMTVLSLFLLMDNLLMDNLLMEDLQMESLLMG